MKKKAVRGQAEREGRLPSVGDQSVLSCLWLLRGSCDGYPLPYSEYSEGLTALPVVRLPSAQSIIFVPYTQLLLKISSTTVQATALTDS
jgi:hypothetical protein